MFCYCLLLAPVCVATVADYVLPLFILFFLLSAPVCVAQRWPIMFCYCLFIIGTRVRSNAVADYVLPLFIFFIFFIYFFLFTVRSQKLLDRFSPNFQELCILV